MLPCLGNLSLYCIKERGIKHGVCTQGLDGCSDETDSVVMNMMEEGYHGMNMVYNWRNCCCS